MVLATGCQLSDRALTTERSLGGSPVFNQTRTGLQLPDASLGDKSSPKVGAGDRRPLVSNRSDRNSKTYATKPSTTSLLARLDSDARLRSRPAGADPDAIAGLIGNSAAQAAWEATSNSAANRPSLEGNGRVQQASFQSDAQVPSAPSDLAPGPPTAPGQDAPAEPADPANATNPLTLPQLLQSVSDHYPEIEVTIGEIETANGKLLATWGEFDTVFSAHSISQPLGFYQTYRNGFGVARPLFGGGEIYSAYRNGDGNFEPWYGERETNEGGELKAGFSIPFLKDRNIDARRAKLMAANANLNGVTASVESKLLRFQRFATLAYWDWVAAGRALNIQQQLLKFAENRAAQVNERVDKGDLAEIARINNEQFITKRINGVIKANRSLAKAAIKLSLFLRDANGQPVVAEPGLLPAGFPTSTPIPLQQLAADTQQAIAVRPEFLALQADREAALIDRQYAENLMLPKLDMKGFAGQDLGGETSSKGDKTPFELQLGLYAEVPLQRRTGAGKRNAAQGKLIQLNAKQQFLADKITAEIRDAASAVNAAYDQIEQSRKNVELSRRSLAFARQQFQAGDIDLIQVNIYEMLVANAELELLDAQFKYVFYTAIYETAISGRAFSTQAPSN